MHKKRIPMLVISPSEIGDRSLFGLNLNDNVIKCHECGSHLFYIKIEWGVVVEDFLYGVLGNRSNRCYALREIGLVIYCSICSEFNEHYGKYFYPEDKLVCTWDEIDGPERAEIEHCLHQFNQKGRFNPLYKCSEARILKEKLMDYEKRHPIKDHIKKKKPSKSITTQ